MSSRRKKAAALAEFKAARQSGLNALDSLDDGEDVEGKDDNNSNDLYDTYTEQEYRSLVEARRQREDFVVDDEGLGYHDDGEERFGDEEGGDDTAAYAKKKKRGSSSNAALTNKALKKVRRNNQAVASTSTEASGGMKNGSMWDFVNKGSSAAASSAAAGGATSAASSDVAPGASRFARKQATQAAAAAPNLDALLQELDQPKKAASSRGASSFSSRGRRSYGGTTSSHRRSVSASRRAMSSSSRRSKRPYHHADDRAAQQRKRDESTRYNDHQEEHDDDDGGFNAFDDGDDNDDYNDDTPGQGDASNNNTATDDDDKKKSPSSTASTPASSKKSVRFADDKGEDNKDTAAEEEAPNVLTQDSVSSNDDSSKDQDNEKEKKPAAATANKPRRRLLARPALGKMSEPAQKALQKQQEQKDNKAGPTVPTVTAPSAAFVQVKSSNLASMGNIASASTSSEESTGTGTGSSSTAGQIPLEQVVVQPPPPTKEGESEEEEEAQEDAATPYIDMFWMDLAERNGDIMLFGKVAVPNGNSNNHKKYVSACAIVSGNVRNLFVLPRADADMAAVHQEINALLHDKRIVPRKAGSSWRGKVVQRDYAFDDVQIPRDSNTNYLKVVYDAKYPAPAEQDCTVGGEHYARILGAGASLTESFIIKRKLMGPCWIRLQQPTACRSPLSWCKVEFTVDSPKRVVRLDLAEQQQLPEGALRKPTPPPPIVSVAIKIKTVVNPKTHKSEIVSVSALCHKNVMLETASDESPKHMTQLSLIRPLDPQQYVAGAAAAVATTTVGRPQFPRDIDQAIRQGMPRLRKEMNERALLSRLLAQIGQWDPDVLVGHNAWGYDMEVILTRCAELGIKTAWSKLGRRRRMGVLGKMSSSSSRNKDYAIADAVAGRLLCDTFLSSKELLRETIYSLTNLAATQLKTSRVEIEPVDIPQYYNTGSAKSIVELAKTTLLDVGLVQRLMFKLQVLPLTKQLTNIAGNIWSHTLKSNRAERTEYLLLHEFHRLKFIPPEKRRGGFKRGENNSSGGNPTKSKAKYSGGLVLEPKKGLYDSFILLLDFNSLYPSLIQEHNLCFTTIDWASHMHANEETEGENDAMQQLPDLPDESVPRGVLPRVIKSLVERRRSVKKIMKTEKNPEKKQELDIRQTALKLTANSMYGCLGFSNSRFFAQPLAALVTAKGRETLQNTVDIAQNKVGLDVIYGDTDSIMINTRINDEADVGKVHGLGERVKREVNGLYKTLELEIDGIFRSMLLLKKKKYAAKTVEIKDGKIVKFGQELKGLDLVRRDWCVQSKDTGRYVTDQILSGQDNETVVNNIHAHLEELAAKMRNGELPLDKYIITKGLSKHPNDYPDGKSQPHVHVAKMMLKENRHVNVGDHIPYVTTAPIVEKEEPGDNNSNKPAPKALSATERARHPEEIARSNGVLKPDVEWYLTQQILPPIARLCEPIEGTSQQILAEKLGLDSSRYRHVARSGADMDADELIDYTPASCLPDEERFKDVEKLKLFCFACGVESNFPGVFHVMKDEEKGTMIPVSGLRCTNPDCTRPMFWGHTSHFECYSKISNTIAIWAKGLMSRYYEGVIRCDEPSCGLETRQCSVAGAVCLRRGCHGRMMPLETERDIHTHLKYLETLFNLDHACEQLEKKKHGRKADLLTGMSKNDQTTYAALHQHAKQSLDFSAFNWITPSFWKGLFHVAVPVEQ